MGWTLYVLNDIILSSDLHLANATMIVLHVSRLRSLRIYSILFLLATLAALRHRRLPRLADVDAHRLELLHLLPMLFASEMLGDELLKSFLARSVRHQETTWCAT